MLYLGGFLLGFWVLVWLIFYRHATNESAAVAIVGYCLLSTYGWLVYHIYELRRERPSG